jgi:hypothetical protein
MLAPFTETVIEPGVVPLMGVTVSQGPPVVETAYVSCPPVDAMASFCDPEEMPR